MPFVEIDETRLERLAALIAANIDALGPGTLEYDQAMRILGSDAAMVAFVLDLHLQENALPPARDAGDGS